MRLERDSTKQMRSSGNAVDMSSPIYVEPLPSGHC